MFKKTKSAISLIVSLLRFCLIKLLRPKGFFFYPLERFSPNTMINIWRRGQLRLGKRVRAHTGVRLSVTPGGLLEIGDDTAFGYNCILVAREHIRIGKGVTCGPNVLIYDHDHDFRGDPKMNGERFITREVVIGDNVWIGAGSIILRGTRIGDNCVIGAGSVVRGEIPPDSVFVQKREASVTPYERGD